MISNLVNLSKPYSRGAYNKFDDNEQWIRISEGCPNMCEFCRESWECGTKPIYFNIPEIVRNQVKIMDMNLIYKPRAKEIIKHLGSQRVNGKVVYYELICGIDYRFMDREIANLLHKNRFIKIRLAWDGSFSKQRQIKAVLRMLTGAGYRSDSITIFMICNWKIPYSENFKKMELCKVWNVKIHDAYFDNQLSPNIKPIYWNEAEIKNFRKMTRRHNQLVAFKIDPLIPGDYEK